MSCTDEVFGKDTAQVALGAQHSSAKPWLAGRASARASWSCSFSTSKVGSPRGEETTPRIRSGGRTRSGAGTEATETWRTSWSCRHTYAPADWSYIASHGSPASAGSSMRSTTRSPSPARAAIAALARYRPATSPVPSSPANSAWPTSRTGCSVCGSTRRLGTAEASTACCSSPRRASSASASSSTVADTSPAGEATTSTRNIPGAPPGPIAISMAVTTCACPYPAQPASSPQLVIYHLALICPADAGPGRNRAVTTATTP